MNWICFWGLFAFCVFLGSLAPKNRRPTAVEYPSDDALLFSESN